VPAHSSFGLDLRRLTGGKRDAQPAESYHLLSGERSVSLEARVLATIPARLAAYRLKAAVAGRRRPRGAAKLPMTNFFGRRTNNSPAQLMTRRSPIVETVD
jgi:hypothetical protein